MISFTVLNLFLLLFRIFLVISVYYSYNSLFIEFLNSPCVLSLTSHVCVYLCLVSIFCLHVTCSSLCFTPRSPCLSCVFMYVCHSPFCPMPLELCQCFPLLAPSSVFPVNSVLMCVPPSQPCVLPHVEFVSQCFLFCFSSLLCSVCLVLLLCVIISIRPSCVCERNMALFLSHILSNVGPHIDSSCQIMSSQLNLP